MVNSEFKMSHYYIWIRFQACFLQNNSYIWNFVNLLNFAIFLLIGLLEENQNACRDKNKLIIHFSTKHDS